MLKIKELRHEIGLKQKDLASNLGISVKKLGAWEQNRAEPSVNDIIRLADFFEVSTDELLGRASNLGYVEIKNELLPLDSELLKEFHKLSDKDQFRVLGYIASLT